MEPRREQAAVLALASHARGPWHLVARLIGETGSALAVAEGRLTGFETPELLARRRPRALPIDPAELDRQRRADRGARGRAGAADDRARRRLPVNLRLVYDRPPFLFVRGRSSRPTWWRSPSSARAPRPPQGLEQADRLAPRSRRSRRHRRLRAREGDRHRRAPRRARRRRTHRSP